jgi:hypothetical protein
MSHDVLLLLAGACLGLVPVLVWMAASGAPWSYWPYSSFIRMVLPSDGPRVGAYVTESRQLMPTAALAPIVLRYYRVLALPIVLALASIALGSSRWLRPRWGRGVADTAANDRFVLLLAVWWILDMALVWVSPRSYEQYYLPLTASAAMLGAYSVGLLHRRLAAMAPRARWTVAAVVALLTVALSHHIVIGLTHSPFSGNAYKSRRRGYAQSVRETLQRLETGPLHTWEQASAEIRAHTRPSDRIYVWGWYPGIYVSAQRLSSSPRACEGSMHTLAPEALAQRVEDILAAFERSPPEVIVDSRKRHFPWNRPPLELWPRTRAGYLPPVRYATDSYDATYVPWLEEQFGKAEARRYEAMKPLREYVMRDFVVAAEHGPHVVFQRRHASPRAAPGAMGG